MKAFLLPLISKMSTDNNSEDGHTFDRMKSTAMGNKLFENTEGEGGLYVMMSVTSEATVL